MKKILYSLLATLSGIVLLFGYRTSHEAVSATALTDASASSNAATGAAAGSATPDPAASSAPYDATSADAGATSDSTATATGGLVDGSYTGSAANTRYGPVQVLVTVSGGRIVDVQVPEYPSSNSKDRQINERALPTLISETTDAQSADIDMVSGATFTSEGYIQSLQSALDQASA